MVMFSKAIIILFLLSIVYSLGSAIYFIMKDPATGTRSVKALTWRVGLSLALLAYLVFAYYQGWIKPHPINVGG